MTVSSTYNRLTSSEERLEVQLRAYMQQDLVNKIIEWKRSNLSHVDNYERFLYELFPENIKTETKEAKADSEKRRMARRQSSFSGKHVIWIDHRVDNNEWKEMFAQVQADDEIKALGLPPGLEDDGDDLLCNAIATTTTKLRSLHLNSIQCQYGGKQNLLGSLVLQR